MNKQDLIEIFLCEMQGIAGELMVDIESSVYEKYVEL